MYVLHTQSWETHLDETCFIFTRIGQLDGSASSRLPSFCERITRAVSIRPPHLRYNCLCKDVEDYYEQQC